MKLIQMTCRSREYDPEKARFAEVTRRCWINPDSVACVLESGDNSIVLLSGVDGELLIPTSVHTVVENLSGGDSYDVIYDVTVGRSESKPLPQSITFQSPFRGGGWYDHDK